jgi:hypothetical protein
MIIFEG